MPPSDNASTELSASGSEAEFDVFLSHNRRDKPLVRELYKTLIAYDLRPWLDEEELVPGRPWQDALEQIIATTKTAAVLYGPAGLGPWEEPEMRACLAEFVRRKLPVIPVLLPGAPEKPDLPLFLQAFTWVDLRDGLTDEGIGKLVWGITGEKPEALPPKKIAPATAGPFAAGLRTRYGQRVGHKWDRTGCTGGIGRCRSSSRPTGWLSFARIGMSRSGVSDCIALTVRRRRRTTGSGVFCARCPTQHATLAAGPRRSNRCSVRATARFRAPAAAAK